MKKMKKIMAMIMAMAMVLGMSLTTFAAGEPKITVKNVPVGAIVKYQQIATAAPTTPLGWAMAQYDADDITQGVKKGDVISLGGSVTLQQLADLKENSNANAAQGTINSNEIVATAIKDIKLTKTATIPAAATGAESVDVEISGVTPGLYVIEVERTGYTFTRMLAYVAWNNDNTGAVENTVVQAKGAPNQVNKEITGEGYGSVSKGDRVPYEINAKYPYFASTVTDPKFEISDTVSGGTIDAKSVKVTVDGEIVYQVKDGETEATVTEDVFTTHIVADKTFTFNFKYNYTKASKDVVITYDVVVDDSAEALKNNVKSNVGNNSTGAMVISPKVEATLSKTDGTNPLKDAFFTLYEETATATAASETTVLIANTATNTISEVEKNYILNENEVWIRVFATEKTVENIDKDTNTVINATATFTGLDAQKKYWVKETQAPDGYSLLETVYPLTGGGINAGTPVMEWVDADGNNKDAQGNPITENTPGAMYVKVTRNTANNFEINNGNDIVNTRLSALPSTGGIGTTIFTIGGVAIMVVAAGLFFVTRKKASK